MFVYQLRVIRLPQMNGYLSLQDCLFSNEKVLSYSWNLVEEIEVRMQNE